MTSLLSTKMDLPIDAELHETSKRQFKQRSSDELKELLDGKDKVNTQKATAGAIKQFTQYLLAKKLPEIDRLDLNDLPSILYDFYPAAKPIKSDGYAVQTLKCLRSALSRYFRKEKGFDITKDAPFIKANEMFKAVLVEAKKNGLGVRKSYPPITSVDLERISEYFVHDHMNKPDPKRLQQQVIFNIIYYFCRRGRENLYEMLQDTFAVITNPDGTQFVLQNRDEIDKNHGPEDTDKTNEGRMYPTESNIFYFHQNTY